jgi:Helicase HerA-like C-terminal
VALTSAHAPADADASPLARADGEQGFVLARRLGGERALPCEHGLVLLSPGRLCRHMLVCGATGSGKTETLLRLAWTIAKTSDAPVFYLDGKGDRQTAMRFCGLMADTGRQTRVFPSEPFDGWRGQPHEIHGRLMEIIDYASQGPASWYRDIAKNVLRLVCEHPEGPPRSSIQALARMDASVLAQAHPRSSVLGALSNDHVRQVRLRYEAFFGQTRGALDGAWAWEDTPAAYFLLDSLILREETGGLARFLFEDFAHYFTTRKPRGRFCVMIVDEFSALAHSTSMASRVEQARGFHTSLILAPQLIAGMGEPSQAQRIVGSVENVVCHRMNTPEEIVALAGTRLAPEHSIHYGPQGPNGEGSTRIQHQFKVDPNKIRSLPTGQAYLISRGRAMRAQILTAPALSAPLPQSGGRQNTAASDKKAKEAPDLPF